MLRIGLTGGIGSGKSEVSTRFARLGVPVVDTDLIARDLVLPGTPALASIAATFGPAVLHPDASLDRTALRRRIFSDPAARIRLEAMLHPAIRAEVERRIRALDAPYCLVVVPLLLEAGWRALVDRVLVVDVAETVQRRRVQARDGLSADELTAVLASQMDRGTRRAAADDLIANDGDLEALTARVANLHSSYLALAKVRDRR